jgi:hypothetical protein
MTVRITATTNPEEMTATEEMLPEKEKERKKKERRERKRMRNYADALRPWQSPIAKPNANITTKRPNTISRNANTTKNGQWLRVAKAAHGERAR